MGPGPGFDEAAALRELWDRQQTSDVVLRFGRALDTHDRALCASTMREELEVDFSDLTGTPPATTTAAAFAELARACLERLVVMHQCSHSSTTVREDEAEGVFHHVSRHRLPNCTGADGHTQHGWYENQFRRTESGWRISRLKHTFQWCSGDPTLIDSSDPGWQRAAAAVFGDRRPR